MMGKDAKLLKQIRQELDRSLEGLDANTCARLTRARQQAIEQQRKRSFSWFYWAPLPAAAVLLLLLVMNWPGSQQVAPVETQVGDLSILTATEPLEFYLEEIEFYEWLSEEFASEDQLSTGSVPAAPGNESLAGTAGRLAGATQQRNARLSGDV